MNIQELRRMEKEGTPRPWYSTEFGIGTKHNSGNVAGDYEQGQCCSHADGELLCAARNALPKLLDIAEAGEKLAEAVRAIKDDLDSCDDPSCECGPQSLVRALAEWERVSK